MVWTLLVCVNLAYIRDQREYITTPRMITFCQLHFLQTLRLCLNLSKKKVSEWDEK